jgi:hypothetical protein
MFFFIKVKKIILSNFVTNTTQLHNARWTMNLNKHYPIIKCWMDDEESTRSQQSSLRLVMPWTNFQTQGDILKYDHLSPPIGMNGGIEKHFCLQLQT